MAEKTKDQLADATLEIAHAIRSKKGENKRQRAGKIMDWGNLVFGGLVVAQAFSPQKDFLLAVIGIVVFAGAYYYAHQITKGGENK